MNASITAGSSNVVGTQCERNYGIDVLKIVAMCMIVGAHILQHGLRYEQVETYTLKWFAVDFLIAMFTCHVDVYALISGYVKAGQKNRLKKACALWLVVFFYSFVSYLIQIIIGKDSFSLIGVAKCLALFISGKYWYFTAYCGLLVIAPYLTKIIDKMDMVSARRFLYGALVFWGIGGWIGGLAGSAGKIIGAYEGYSTVWLAIMYCVGYAVRKYGSEVIFFTKKKIFGFSYCLSVVLVFVSSILLKNVAGGGMYLYFYNYLCPLVVIEAVSLLCLFTNIRIDDRFKKTVLAFSASTFGIYIFHTTPFACGIVYPILNQWIKAKVITYFFIFVIATVIVFLISFAIEMCRNKLFRLLRIEKLLQQITEIFDKIIMRYLR